MYLQLLNYISYFFNFLFFAFLIYALEWKEIKQLWQNAIAKVKIPAMIRNAKKEGKHPFYFNNGKTIIYAVTEEQAKFRFNELKKKRRANPLKKA